MAKPPKIKTVRTFCTSNVGADEDTKTLWILVQGDHVISAFPFPSISSRSQLDSAQHK